jgi:hypothetical protein
VSVGRRLLGCYPDLQPSLDQAHRSQRYSTYPVHLSQVTLPVHLSKVTLPVHLSKVTLPVSSYPVHLSSVYSSNSLVRGKSWHLFLLGLPFLPCDPFYDNYLSDITLKTDSCSNHHCLVFHLPFSSGSLVHHNGKHFPNRFYPI